MLAAQYGHLDFVTMMVERGADLTLRDELYHATAEQAAEYFKYVAVKHYLASRGS